MIREELMKRNIPDLFKINGETITTKEEWEDIGRPYWKNLLLQEEYGRFPKVLCPTIEVKKDRFEYRDFGGGVKWEEVIFTFENNGKKHSVSTHMLYPKTNVPQQFPFFIYLNFHPSAPTLYLPIEEIVANGFGVLTVCYNDITKDNNDFTDGLAGLFQEGERTGDDAGKIVYWSYMASRMMDYLQTREEVDKNAIAVAGHSRLGKTALLTAAMDERFAFACVNNSGTSGAAISRGLCKGGESIRDIVERFPFWFCLNYFKYMDKADELPFDQHCLTALVAPRRVYVGGATEDRWADNDNQFLNCVAASPAWTLYGKKGFVTPNKMPMGGEILYDGNVGFHLRFGTHFFNRSDWLTYMDAVKKNFNRE